jgi:TetR/AcrR family transcriptional regulator, fatty acid biosynthesis regulator
MVYSGWPLCELPKARTRDCPSLTLAFAVVTVGYVGVTSDPRRDTMAQSVSRMGRQGKGAASGAVKRRRMRGGERREQLLDVAAAIVRSQGVHAVTMERVAAEAAVSKPVVYSHFANTTDLVDALLGREERALDASVAEQVAKATTVRETLQACGRPWFDAFTGADPLYRRLVLEQAAKPQLEQGRVERRFAVVEFLATLLHERAGLKRRDARIAAAVLIGGFESAASYWSIARSIGREHVRDMYEAMAEAAISAISADDL